MADNETRPAISAILDTMTEEQLYVALMAVATINNGAFAGVVMHACKQGIKLINDAEIHLGYAEAITGSLPKCATCGDPLSEIDAVHFGPDCAFCWYGSEEAKEIV